MVHQLEETKSVHINFAKKNEQHFPISMNNDHIPYAYSVKYLDITLDARHC